MNLLRLLKNIGIIVGGSFIIMICLMIILGIVIDLEMAISLLIIAILYGLMAIGLFLNESSSHIKMIVLQIIYVIMMNVIYIVMMIIRGLHFNYGFVYGIIGLFTIIGFLIIKYIIYCYDKKTADLLNQQLHNYKNNRRNIDI